MPYSLFTSPPPPSPPPTYSDTHSIVLIAKTSIGTFCLCLCKCSIYYFLLFCIWHPLSPPLSVVPFSIHSLPPQRSSLSTVDLSRRNEIRVRKARIWGLGVNNKGLIVVVKDICLFYAYHDLNNLDCHKKIKDLKNMTTLM